MAEEDPNRILLDWYISQVSSHVESMVGIVFGLIGSLVLILESHIQGVITFFKLFLIIYFLIGFGGLYFYFRLVYFNQMAEECLTNAHAWDVHLQRRRDALQRLRGPDWFWSSVHNEDQEGRYRPRYVWVGAFMYSLVIFGTGVGILLWGFR